MPETWRVMPDLHGFHVLSDDGREVATGNGCGAFWRREDADLAAAAPDLLAACEAMLNCLTVYGPHALPLLDRAEAAIAKAKGGA